MSPSVFSTVPDKDYLKLFKGDEPDYDKVVKFTHFKKDEISKATGISVSSIRYDKNIPQELRDRFIEWGNLLNLVAGFFNPDVHKTALWFTVQNPLLGNMSPRDMIRIGRYKRLMAFVVNAIEENRPPAKK
jgi:hypothetical protein